MNIIYTEKLNSVLSSIFSNMNRELEHLRYEIDVWRLEIYEIKEHINNNTEYKKKLKK